MTYLIFSTESEALAADQQIITNVVTYAAVNTPERLAPDQTIICYNAATGELAPDAQHIERWAVPVEYVEGWGFPKPEANQVQPMTVAEVLAGVGGTEVINVTIIQDDVLYES